MALAQKFRNSSTISDLVTAIDKYKNSQKQGSEHCASTSKGAKEGKAVLVATKGQSLFLWKGLAKQKKMEETQEALSMKKLAEWDLPRWAGPPPSVNDFSETSTACSSEDEAQALEPLLWVSEPRFEGPSTRLQFALTIGRSSCAQRFGLTLTAKRDGTIMIAEDAMQFGVAKGDVVLSINGCQALTVEECQRILNSALKIELSLLRADVDAQGRRQGKSWKWNISQKSSWTNRQGRKCIDLLAVSPQPCLSAGAEDQFTVRLNRASRDQKFGLNLTTVNSDATASNLTGGIYIAANLPHLRLKAGDQVLSLNGRMVGNVAEFRKSLDTCMNVELLVRRQSSASSEDKPDDSFWQDFVEDLENEPVDWITVPEIDDEPRLCVPKKSVL
jgi:hypothetical protein